MSFLSLNDVKRHLLIDHNDDDMYIADLITVAEDAVRVDLNRESLRELEGVNGMLPPSVLHAMLLLVGTYYANRESVTYGTPHEVPFGLSYLLDLWRRY